MKTSLRAELLYIHDCGSGLETAHAALTVIRAIFRSSFSGLNLRDQKIAVEALDKIAHPDVHFFYPTNSTSKVKKASSSDFIEEWRAFLEKRQKLISERMVLRNWAWQ